MTLITIIRQRFGKMRSEELGKIIGAVAAAFRSKKEINTSIISICLTEPLARGVAGSRETKPFCASFVHRKPLFLSHGRRTLRNDAAFSNFLAQTDTITEFYRPRVWRHELLPLGVLAEMQNTPALSVGLRTRSSTRNMAAGTQPGTLFSLYAIA
mgnify:CR=1 FL=1